MEVDFSHQFIKAHHAVMLFVEPISGKILDANLAAERFYQYTIEQLKAMKIDQINIIPESELILERTRAFNNESKYFSFNHRLKDGTICPVQVYSSPCKYGERDALLSIIHDVSNLKKTEEALLNSEERYRVLSDMTMEGIIIHKEGLIRDINNSVEKLLGYEKEELINKNVIELIYLDDQALVKENMVKEYSYPYQVRIIKKNKEVFWAEIEARNFNWRGELLRAAAVRDITDRKEAQKRLEESEENFRGFFETMEDMVVVGDQQGRIYHVNSATTKKLGYSISELNNMHILDLNPKKQRAEAEQIFRDMFAGKRDSCPLPLERKGGTYLPAETRIRFGRWGGKECIFGVCRDLSKEQEALQIFNKMFDSNPALMAISNADAKEFINVNNAFLETLGYSKEEVIGRTTKELEIFTQQEKHDGIAEELKREGKIRNVELKLKTKDGKLLDGLFSGEVINSQGKNYLLTVMINITEVKKAERDLYNLSYKDYLTGLYNRRYMEGELSKLDTENKLPLTFMVLDVNGLKLTNDAFGHKMGNQLLKKVADILIKTCRADDIVCRIGGDEFALLLTNTDKIKAEIIKKRIIDASSKVKLDSVIVSLAIGYCVKSREEESMEMIMTFADNNMYKNKLRYGKTMRSKTIETVLKNINLKYDQEQIHTERVSQYCESIAKAMLFTEKEIEEIKTAAVLHDIGKIMVPPELLNRESRLTAEEFEIIKKHAETGYQMLKSVDEFLPLAETVLYHHERWDGNGYPEGLRGEDIPLEARIIAVADAYEAMTAKRSYQRIKTKEEALEELKRFAGIQFDPDIVNIFIEKVI